MKTFATFTFALMLGVAGSAASAQDHGPLAGVGQVRPRSGPDALTSTAVQVTSAVAASTVTTAISGARRRRW